MSLLLRLQAAQHVCRHEHHTFLGHMKSPGVLPPIDAYLHTVGNLTPFIDDGSLDDTGRADLDMRQYHDRLILERSSIRTSENSNDERTTAPEMMQPPDTTELMAVPRRLPHPGRNFAGGCCTW